MTYEPLDWGGSKWVLFQCDDCETWEWFRINPGTKIPWATQYWSFNPFPDRTQEWLEHEVRAQRLWVLEAGLSRTDTPHRLYARCPSCKLAHDTLEIL